jgi:hypothetical protein
MGAFKVISADSHIVEPPDMYTSRIERRFRERAPPIDRLKTPAGREYDAWMQDGVQVGTLEWSRKLAAVRGPLANRLSRRLERCAERRLGTIRRCRHIRGSCSLTAKLKVWMCASARTR